MKYTVHENVELHSASYWQDWQVKLEDVAVKSFIRKENADVYCECLNNGDTQEEAFKKTFEEALKRSKNLGLNREQSERNVKKSEPWAFGEFSCQIL